MRWAASRPLSHLQRGTWARHRISVHRRRAHAIRGGADAENDPPLNFAPLLIIAAPRDSAAPWAPRMAHAVRRPARRTPHADLAMGDHRLKREKSRRLSRNGESENRSLTAEAASPHKGDG